MNDHFTQWRKQILAALHSSTGRDVVLYLVCVCVAFVFWVFLSLDSEVQRDYDVPVQLENVPDSVTILSAVPQKFSVTVQGKGSQFLRFWGGRLPVLKMKFEDNVADHSTFAMSKQKIDGRLRDYFGQGVQIVMVRPDSLRLQYTTAPGIMLPLRIVADVHPDLQSIINGPVTADIDSVKVFALNGIPRSISEVETMPLNRTGLRDTSLFEVRLKPLDGIRMIPDKVVVKVPVEPLISRRMNVAVETTDLPQGLGLITFPSHVKLEFLVPMSAYNDDIPVRAYVDFNDIVRTSSKVKVRISSLPDICRNVSVTPDSVEYILEKKHLQ